MSRKFETVVAKTITTNEIKKNPIEGEITKISEKVFTDKEKTKQNNGELVEKKKMFVMMKPDNGEAFNLICDSGLFYALREAEAKIGEYIKITFLSQEMQKSGNKRNTYKIEKAV